RRDCELVHNRRWPFVQLSGRADKSPQAPAFAADENIVRLPSSVPIWSLALGRAKNLFHCGARKGRRILFRALATQVHAPCQVTAVSILRAIVASAANPLNLDADPAILIPAFESGFRGQLDEAILAWAKVETQVETKDTKPETKDTKQ